MTPAERITYHRTFWPAACRAQGWSPNDTGRRHAAVLECMRLVRGPAVTTSAPAFGHDEVTALFCYLDHLAHPDDLDRSARWVDCQQDYRAYNRARQADYYQRRYVGEGPNKLTRDRFAGAQRAVGEPLEEFDPAAIQKRFITFASRVQKAEREQRRPGAQLQLPVNPPPPIVAPEIRPRNLEGSAAPF